MDHEAVINICMFMDYGYVVWIVVYDLKMLVGMLRLCFMQTDSWA